MGAIYFQSPLNTKLHMKFERNLAQGLKGEVVQRCERTDDGRAVITIAHHKPLAQVS